ncbi:MAG: hypothetical protein JNM75_13810 [Rhodospirillales bacterium]|nr:hypothetical protein [Rhodospirillales bacterium]
MDDGLARFFGVMTSILVGACGFLLILLFAGLYLSVVEWSLGPVDDRRFVIAGGLLLGFAIAMRGLDAFVRWFHRNR